MRMERSELVKKMVVGLIGIVIFIGGLVACTKLVTNEIKKEIDIISTASLVDDRDKDVYGVSNIHKNYEEIDYGMSEDEVRLILGKPRSSAEYEMNGKQHKVVTYDVTTDSTSYIRITLIDDRLDDIEIVDTEE